MENIREKNGLKSKAANHQIQAALQKFHLRMLEESLPNCMKIQQIILRDFLWIDTIILQLFQQIQALESILILQLLLLKLTRNKNFEEKVKSKKS